MYFDINAEETTKEDSVRHGASTNWFSKCCNGLLALSNIASNFLIIIIGFIRFSKALKTSNCESRESLSGHMEGFAVITRGRRLHLRILSYNGATALTERKNCTLASSETLRSSSIEIKRKVSIPTYISLNSWMCMGHLH
ncbi:hypothetical protein CEXT_77001 [Caerostris extrusa]|uniref:Uncharacterized protein n=1 Tax=Caerostris extrusa TaxID=172846 RepID=A0AAV4QS22_CAEEX|nr:hypothetical protein CEXT_77001 [Caerostris extrusa]